MSKGIRLAAGLAGLALLVAACGEAPDENKGSEAAGPLACMVTDTGGIDDRSFNAAAWKGMQAGAKATSGKADYVASTSENDYIPNITNLINKGCDTIVTVGGLMGDATTQASKDNPNQQFAIVDSGSVEGQKVYGMQFNTAQSSFQAGYLAAATSQTGKVATFGGLAIPPVTIFMDGFYEGVQYFNEKKGKKVEVIGWDPAKPDSGSIAGDFGDQAKGKTISKGFIEQGADVIFPVAGGTGLGAAAAAKESGGKVSVIWVDSDGCESVAEYCDVFLTSVLKNVAGAVEEAITKAGAGDLTGGYLGTLENGGTGLAPFHQYDAKVPADVKAELDKIKADIVSGAITIKSAAQPKG
ncbi:BMP family ABC transporter substrate-binding protein [Actinocorallia sp. API 0066]|uniref:BMP family lipoprotein n=1 Tax=Actinocorallia sp. API 0066 TaxID=2896846 RepID=UPI001E36BC8D|nr:BMP family ABC transporter substrate-binding protein [Actinocorallia sp. API 0066]MCD0453109.1 BMP family ABC transporter substrate-binding protein [Actinocorallia sp. API 0066]